MLISWKSDLNSTQVLIVHRTSENTVEWNVSVDFCLVSSSALEAPVVMCWELHQPPGPGMWEHPVPKDECSCVSACVPRGSLALPLDAHSPLVRCGKMAVNIRLGLQCLWTPAIHSSGVEAFGHSGKIRRFGLTDVKLTMHWQSRFVLFCF